jgi:hypothetical protein
LTMVTLVMMLVLSMVRWWWWNRPIWKVWCGAHARRAGIELLLLPLLLLLLPCQVVMLWLLGYRRRHERRLRLWCIGRLRWVLLKWRRRELGSCREVLLLLLPCRYGRKRTRLGQGTWMKGRRRLSPSHRSCRWNRTKSRRPHAWPPWRRGWGSPSSC